MANRRPGSASDPLWYKDAIIYELHVKGFTADASSGVDAGKCGFRGMPISVPR